MQVEEAKKKSGLLAERKTVKLALTKAEDELKSLQQKSFDEEQARSLEITKINAENKQEITELEKKNESVARHFAAAKVANPTPSQGRAAPQSLKNTVATQETTKLTQEKIRSKLKFLDLLLIHLLAIHPTLCWVKRPRPGHSRNFLLQDHVKV